MTVDIKVSLNQAQIMDAATQPARNAAEPQHFRETQQVQAIKIDICHQRWCCAKRSLNRKRRERDAPVENTQVQSTIQDQNVVFVNRVGDVPVQAPAKCREADCLRQSAEVHVLNAQSETQAKLSIPLRRPDAQAI